MSIRRFTAKMLLALSSFALTALALELALGLFLPPRSKIIMPDPDFGWRYRPNSEGLLGHVTVRINAKGLGGPELPYEKPAGVTRIVYLGDSVAFGYGLPSHEVTFPYLVEKRLQDRTGRKIETVNAAVNGYCTWQEHMMLSTEGIRYHPDLVILSFVLNDITEKSGRYDFGRQKWDHLPASVLGSRLSFWLHETQTYRFAQQFAGWTQFGSRTQRGARRHEKVDVLRLVDHPHEPGASKAWEVTRQELHDLFEYCKSRQVPVLLVIFPFTIQFRKLATRSEPQRILISYADEAGVPNLDLLPRLAEEMKRNDENPKTYFFDNDHPTVRGSEVVADILAGFILESGLLPMGAF